MVIEVKKILCIILALVCCAGFAACSKDEGVPDGYQLVSGDDVAYRFYAPTQWSLNTGSDVDSVYYSDIDRSMVMVSFYLPDEDQKNVDALWTYVENQYKSQYKNYQLIESAAATLGGKNAKSYTFTANIGDTDYKIMQVVAGYKDYYYMLSYMTSPELFDLHLADVNGMIGVFSFR